MSHDPREPHEAVNQPPVEPSPASREPGGAKPIAVFAAIAIAIGAPLKLCSRAVKGGARLGDDVARYVHPTPRIPWAPLARPAQKGYEQWSRDREKESQRDARGLALPQDQGSVYVSDPYDAPRP